MERCGLCLGGLHKLSAVDYPGLLAAVVFTQGCNFHCPYCHNPQLLGQDGNAAGPESEEVLTFLRKRAGQLDAVVISGGEPTLQPGLAAFCAAAKALGYRVKLDTNGSRPSVLAALLAGRLLDYVALDYKTVPDQYVPALSHEPETAQRVRESAALLAAADIKHEFRTTCVSPFVTPQLAPDLAAAVKGHAPWYLQHARLTPAMRRQGLHALTPQEMESLLRAAPAQARLRRET